MVADSAGTMVGVFTANGTDEWGDTFDDLAEYDFEVAQPPLPYHGWGPR